MAKTIITQGRTSTEAIEAGLKQLKVSKDKVEIKILENESKRSFFSILTPRVVKVELTLKEEVQEKKTVDSQNHVEKEKKNILNEQEIKQIKERITNFLEQFIKNMPSINYKIEEEGDYIYIALNGEQAGSLIGYRGETLNAMQVILSSIANKGIDKKVHVILDIEQYREKRKQSLEELADKLARTVIRTDKKVTLEPMSAYERKIIHNRLQDSQRVKTYSIGEEPYRKVVIIKK